LFWLSHSRLCRATKVHWKKSTNESEGKPEQKFDAAFKEASGDFKLIFLLN
jgi:hypothetical protein